MQANVDVLNGKTRPALTPPAQNPMGRMQIDVRLRPGDPTAADAEAIIFSEDRYVHLDGIVVREPRPGWVTLQVPPLEAWESRLRWLLARTTGAGGDTGVLPTRPAARHPPLPGVEAQGGVSGQASRRSKELPAIDARAASGLGQSLPMRPALPISGP